MLVMENRQSCARRRAAAGVMAIAMAVAVLVVDGTAAHAAIVPTVPLGTSGEYAVLGASTVTNTGDSTLYGSLGLSPGTAITGFPPGLVFPPGTEHDAADPAGGQAQADLTDAYGNAKGRSFDTTTTAELAGKTLGPGVYIGPGKSPLWIGGALTLDGENNPDAVFIFQTDSTLVTGSASSVRLINGAKECNVFWQVGSSATLGTFSYFTGTILALTSVTVTTGVTVHGRALATTGAVTLDDDTFILPTCAATTTPSGGTTDSTTPGGGATVTTTPTGGATVITTPTGGGTDIGTETGIGGTDTSFTRPSSLSLTPPRVPGVPGVVGAPRTGAAPPRPVGFPWLVLLAGLLGGAGTVSLIPSRRTHTDPGRTPTPER